MIDLWILLCIIFVALALLEYGLVIKIRYNNRGLTEQEHVLDTKKNWTLVKKELYLLKSRRKILLLMFQIIDRSSSYIFPIVFIIVNIVYGMIPIYNTESGGINTTNYDENYEYL